MSSEQFRGLLVQGQQVAGGSPVGTFINFGPNTQASQCTPPTVLTWVIVHTTKDQQSCVPYRYACVYPSNTVGMIPISCILSFISGRVLSPTWTPVSRQASCYIGLPLRRELALLAFCMLWLCDMTEVSRTCSMQLFKLCQLLKVRFVCMFKKRTPLLPSGVQWPNCS